MAYLELINVRKQFGSSWAVDTFNLSIDKGEFISFLGPSGCGKTTTLRMVAGFEKQTSGTIKINGQDVSNLPANKRKIGMVFQSYALFPNMTVADNIAFGLKVARKTPDYIRQRVSEMLELIHLPEIGRRFPHQLSGGQQQRVALARAIAIEPQVLLLDEPLSALDAKIRVALRQEIRAIQRKLGITAIYVTHDQEEALSISDRVVVMNKGKAEQVGRPLEIYNTPQTPFVASFVGTLNVLNAKVESSTEGKVSLAGQVLEVGKQIPENPGQPVAIAIRPEAFALQNGVVHPGVNRLKGVVEDMYFLGSVMRLRISVNEQYINADVFNTQNLKLPERGSDVTLNFAPAACMVMNSNHVQPAAHEA